MVPGPHEGHTKQGVSGVTTTKPALVTVAICTRNRADLLRECLCALHAQARDLSSVQVLVVDNGSTDETQEVMREFSNRFAKWLGVTEPRTGLSHARNRALACAETDWVAFLDDDARPLHGYASRLQMLAAGGEFDCVGGVYLPWYRDGRKAWFRDSYASNSASIQVFGELPTGRNASGGNCLLRRQAALDAGGFSAELGMTGKRRAYGEETRLQFEMRRMGFLIGGAPDWRVEHLAPLTKQSLLELLQLAWRVGRDHWATFGEYPTAGVLLGRVRRLVSRPLVGLHRELSSDNKQPRHWQNLVLAIGRPLLMTLGEVAEAIRLRMAGKA